MKKIFFIVCCFLVTASLAFAEEYDGVWVSQDFGGDTYFLIIDNSDSLVFFQVDSNLASCDPNYGTLKKNVAIIKTIPMPGEDHFLEAQITFTSKSTATGVFLACSGECQVTAPGFAWAMTKIY